MFKVMIVDDEPSVRFGLRHYVNWEAYQMTVVGEADDGDVALEQIEELHPDIVLADVHMVNMSGIEMAKQLRRTHPHIKVVFVSGHDDIEYLKSALQVHAVDYVFKPVDLDELKLVIHDLQQALQQAHQERQLISHMQTKLTESLPLLREKFLMSLLQGGYNDLSRLGERLAFLEMTIPLNGVYWVATIRIDDRTQTIDPLPEKDKQLLSYALLNICQELIDQYWQGYAFESQLGEYRVLLWSSDDERDWEHPLLSLLEHLQSNIQRWLKLSVTIGLGEKVSSLHQLSESRASSQLAADQKWYLGKQKIITVDSLQSKDTRSFQVADTYAENILMALKAGDKVSMTEELQTLFAQLTHSYHYSRNMSLRLLLLSSRLLLEFGIESERDEAEVIEKLLKQETMDDLQLVTRQYLLEVCDIIHEKRSGKNTNIIEKIQSIIACRYMENLTVSDIAESVYLSPTYVSLIFRQETGETLYEYLTKKRIEVAKTLLSDPQRKLYEICEAVGYSDASHFSKLFKKQTGLTPTNYRELII